MEDGFLRAFQRLDSATNELFPAGRKDLQPDIIRSQVGRLNEASREVEICLRCGRKGNLNLLVAQLNELLEIDKLLLTVHGINERLIAIAQASLQPSWRLVNGLRGPLSVWEVQWLEALILFRWIGKPMQGQNEYVNTTA